VANYAYRRVDGLDVVYAAMSSSEHILIVDDLAEIREMLQTYLTQQGYRVSVAADGAELRRTIAQESVDLVILDLMLPGEDGLSLTRYLREHFDVSIIILTGRGEIVDRIVGLELGADDYIAKPFDLRELLARTKSVLRRAKKLTSVAGETQKKVLFAGWTLDIDSRQLLSPQGSEVPLTTGEFELLVGFVNHPNRVLSRDELLDLTRNRKAMPFDRSIDVQVGRLRRKIEADPERPTIIKTVRGAGYIFATKIERL
jgi:DNA-binding response OmpR family regulator